MKRIQKDINKVNSTDSIPQVSTPNFDLTTRGKENETPEGTRGRFIFYTFIPYSNLISKAFICNFYESDNYWNDVIKVRRLIKHKNKIV